MPDDLYTRLAQPQLWINALVVILSFYLGHHFGKKQQPVKLEPKSAPTPEPQPDPAHLAELKRIANKLRSANPGLEIELKGIYCSLSRGPSSMFWIQDGRLFADGCHERNNGTHTIRIDGGLPEGLALDDPDRDQKLAAFWENFGIKYEAQEPASA